MRTKIVTVVRLEMSREHFPVENFLFEEFEIPLHLLAYESIKRS